MLICDLIKNQDTYQADLSNTVLEVGPPTAEDVEAAKLRVSEIQPPVTLRANKRSGEARLSAAPS